MNKCIVVISPWIEIWSCFIPDTTSNITAVRWKGNNTVNAISIFAGKEHQTITKRFCRKERKKIDVKQPKIINIYNQNMGDVDRIDQNISSHMTNLRAKKWWWPLFCSGIDVSVNNAFQIYRQCDQQPGKITLDLLGFRRSIVEIFFVIS